MDEYFLTVCYFPALSWKFVAVFFHFGHRFSSVDAAGRKQEFRNVGQDQTVDQHVRNETSGWFAEERQSFAAGSVSGNRRGQDVLAENDGEVFQSGGDEGFQRRVGPKRKESLGGHDHQQVSDVHKDDAEVREAPGEQGRPFVLLLFGRGVGLREAPNQAQVPSKCNVQRAPVVVGSGLILVCSRRRSRIAWKTCATRRPRAAPSTYRTMLNVTPW
jgi:hypothetical protein